jgi:hypothetical protein
MYLFLFFVYAIKNLMALKLTQNSTILIGLLIKKGPVLKYQSPVLLDAKILQRNVQTTE